MINHVVMSPMLAKKVKTMEAKTVMQSSLEAQQTAIQPFNPQLKDAVLANSKQIISPKTIVSVGATPAQTRVPEYKNQLKEMLVSNKANILAVVLRTMNAKDTDGNGLIQGDEQKGNLVNDVERLDEIKKQGFNTLHILPIHPTGKINALGTAGSLYSPSDFLAIDPELVDENPPKEVWDKIAELYQQKTGRKLQKMDKNDPEVAFAQCKYFIDECHKRGIEVMLDLPSCASIDYAKAHPSMMAVDNFGKEKVPQGWQDIRMFKPFEDEQKRSLNLELLDMHKKYVDMCVDLGFDGIRADVGRAKPVEFWNVIINYSHIKDSNFGWLAETYTHEDASPQLNMPYDRPQELLEVGFDSFYGQYHIFNEWIKNTQLYDYVKENIDLNNKIVARTGSKSVLGSFGTHDDKSQMLYGGAPWVMFTTILQGMLPQVNPYILDGTQTGDYYKYPYEHAIVKDTNTDSNECHVHSGKMDIFNNSRKPGGDHYEILDAVRSIFALRDGKYNDVVQNQTTKLQMKNAQDVITKGSFIILPTNNQEIIAFARHKDGKTLVFIGNMNANEKVGGKVEIPGLKPTQKFKNLMPKYGEDCKFQNNLDGTITVELGTSRACVFEIDDENIEKLSAKENIMQQEFI